MIIHSESSTVSSVQPGDERSLLIRLELLLEREEELLDAHRPDALTALSALAEEREQVTERLAFAARSRHETAGSDVARDAELVALYQRLRHRHDVRAQVVCRRAERNERAIGVLAQATAQATGCDGLYQADGRVPLQFVSS